MNFLDKLIKDVDTWNFNSREGELYKGFLVALKTENEGELIKVCKETKFVDTYLDICDSLQKNNIVNSKWLPILETNGIISWFIRRFIFDEIPKGSLNEKFLSTIRNYGETKKRKYFKQFEKLLYQVNPGCNDQEALYIAIQYELKDVISQLVYHKEVDISFNDNFALKLAINTKKLDIINLFLSAYKTRNVDLSIKNNEILYYTAFRLTEFDMVKEIFDYLLHDDNIKISAKRGLGIKEVFRLYMMRLDKKFIKWWLNKFKENKWPLKKESQEWILTEINTEIQKYDLKIRKKIKEKKEIKGKKIKLSELEKLKLLDIRLDIVDLRKQENKWIDVLLVVFQYEVLFDDEIIKKYKQILFNYVERDLFNFISEFQKYNTENFIYSPYSIFLCMMLLTNGTQGDSQKELQEYFPLKNKVLKIINKELSLTFSNGLIFNLSLFGEYDYKDKYLQKLVKYFGAYLENTHFDSTKKINELIKEKTNVDNVIQTLNEKNDVLLLVNTLFFVGVWDEPFEEIKPKKFESFGESFEVPMMKIKYIVKFAATHEWNDVKFLTVTLTYTNNFKMIFIIPEESTLENFERLEKELLKRHFLKEIRKEQTPKFITTLKIPKFKIKIDNNLITSIFPKIGIKSIFSPSDDFKPMITHKDTLSISKIYHNVNLEVNDIGTNASSATVQKIIKNIKYEKRKKLKLKFNRPFIGCLFYETLPIIIYKYIHPFYVQTL